MINHRSGSRDLFMLFQKFSLPVVFTAITLVNTCIYLHPYLQVLHCTPWLCCDLDKLFYEIRWIEHGKILPSYIMCIVVYGCMNIYKWVCAKFLHIFLPGCCHTTVLTYSNVCWSSWLNVPKFVTLKSQTVDRPILSKKLTTFQPGVDNFIS